MDTLRIVLDSDYAPLRQLKPRALTQFRLTIARYEEHLGRPPLVTDLTGLQVQGFLAARRSKVSIATVCKDRVHIVAIWNHLFRLRRVDVAPGAVLSPLRAPKRVPKAYRAHEVSAILRAAKAMHGQVSGRPAGLWHASLIRTAFETAERIGALLAVEWRDVDLEDRTILLRAENRKGGSRDLLRPIGVETAAWIAALRRDARERDLVWRWDRVPTHLWWHYRKICKLAGVPCRGYHGLRKSNASYLALASSVAEAAGQLGHASPTVTIEHYVDPTICKPKNDPLAMLPALDLGPQVPADPAADALEAAQRAGFRAGKALAAAGLPRPARDAMNALAAAAGFSGDHAAIYREGLALGFHVTSETPST